MFPRSTSFCKLVYLYRIDMNICTNFPSAFLHNEVIHQNTTYYYHLKYQNISLDYPIFGLQFPSPVDKMFQLLPSASV